MDIAFNTYYTYPQLTERLAWLAEQHPQIMQVKALGKTLRGPRHPAGGADQHRDRAGHREAHVLDRRQHPCHGADRVDGRLVLHQKDRRGLWQRPEDHARAGRRSRSTSCRGSTPTARSGRWPTKPKFIRSGTRPYPLAEKRDGLHDEDIDGNGRILQMRIADPTGDWKVSERDPRLMIKRGPDEEGGTYYRLFSEGLIENYDGQMISPAPPLHGLDFNRNFPGAWRPEGEQDGAGDFPGSEPEIRAVIEFMAKHPNVFGALTFHTYSRAILRPFGTKADSEMDTNDLWVFEAIGERGTALTGYPCVSVYHHFRYHPKEVITGVFDDWLFEHKGIFAFTVEMWDLATAAGVEEKSKDKKFMDWFRKHPVEDDYKIVAYADEHAPGGLAPWYEFDHPQLGKVELGGWDNLYTWRNPPHALLEAEIAHHADFALAFAALAPRLAWREVKLTPVGEGAYHLLAVVENTGFLPTYGSNQAKKMKAVRPVRLEVTLPTGATLVGGKQKQEIGQLEGRSNKLDVSFGDSPTDNRGKAEWLIHAPAGGALTLRATAERGGTLVKDLSLSQP